MRQRPLAQAAGKHLFDRTDEPRRSISGYQQRIDQSARFEIAQEIAAARRVLFGSPAQPEQHFLAALTIAETLPTLAAGRVETMLEEMNEVASTNSGPVEVK